MRQRIGLVTVAVNDYDEAIRYYTQVLGFTLLEDTPLGGKKRWVVVAPQGAEECGLLLAVAASEEPQRAVEVGCIFLQTHRARVNRAVAVSEQHAAAKFFEQRADFSDGGFAS